MDRRRILKSIGTGITLSGTAGVASADKGPNKKSNISQEYDGNNRKRILGQAKSDTDLRRIVKHLNSEGWVPNWSSAEVRKATSPDGIDSYDYIVVGCSSKGSINRDPSTEAVLFWFGNSTTDFGLDEHTFAHITRENPKLYSSENKYASVFPFDELTVIYNDNGVIVTETNEYVITKSDDEDGISTQGEIGPEYCKVNACVGNPATWECFAVTVAGLGLSIDDCGACIAFKKPKSCMKCGIGLIVTGVSGATDCLDICEDRFVVEIEKWYVEEHFHVPEGEDACTYYDPANGGREVPIDPTVVPTKKIY